MGEASERADKAPSRSEGGEPKRQPPAEAPELLPWSLDAALLDLHQAVGNRVVARMVERGSVSPNRVPAPSHVVALRGDGEARAFNRIQRQPNASLPPPNQSTAPPAPKFRNNGINYQGELIFPDSAGSKATLKKLLPAKGREGASSWGHSMLVPSAEQKAIWSIIADDDYVQRCIDAMRTAVTEFDEECRIFMEKFETKAGNLTDAMLINAEEQIHKEQEKLGMKADVEVDYRDRDVTTTYTATNKAYLAEAKSAAADLAKRRSLADFRAEKAAEARRKAEQTRAMLPQGFDPNAFGINQPPTPTPVNIGGTTGTVTLMTDQEMTHKSWRDAEDDFKKHASEATGKYATLGPLLAGGKGTAERLKAFSEETPAQSQQNLGEQFAEKLKNIQTVRGELGKRFSIWKQPTIISITHQQMNSGPGEQRMVRDKVREITEDEKSTKEMYAAIALGVGLLAAIPTGGSSVIAGVALAASITGAAMSAYTAYEEAQEYLLQSAAANTSLDRAYEISKDEPSMLWLAIDIAAAVADLGAAKAAFLTLKETIAVAKAAKSIEKLPEVLGKMRSAHISPANQARIVGEILPAGGDVGKALHEIRQAFIRTAEVAENKELAEIMKAVGEKAMDNARVMVVPHSREEALKVIRAQLENRGFKGDVLEEEARSFFDELFANEDALRKSGFYDSVNKLIVVRGNTTAEGAAAILMHEAVHLGQDTQKMLMRMGKFKSEIEAFTAQQQFLRMLPPDRVPADFQWLVAMSPADLEQHVLSFYAKEGAVKEITNHKDIAAGIYNTLFQAGGGAKR